MLRELRITDLGVIPELTLLFEAGLTAVTGETGAGKTMVVEAIDLLMGGRADSHLVRPGAEEATVEGRFETAEGELILRRTLPREGRSRAYVDGGLATAAALAELGAELVDLHGQHAHQSLLSAAVQRSALDRFGRVETGPLTAARAELHAIEAALADLGGDGRERAREIDLCRFQVEELDAAALTDADEDERLGLLEDDLADAVAHREAGHRALDALDADGGGTAALGTAMESIDERRPFAELSVRLRSLVVELDDVRSELRQAIEQIDDDPARLAAVRERRRLLHDLRRKYGESLADVLVFADQARARLAELEQYDERAADLDRRRIAAAAKLELAQQEVGAQRRAAAEPLAVAVEAELIQLAMPEARFAVTVDGPAGAEVGFGLAANPGGDVLPLAKVASGGELARAMLAFRMVLTGAPPVLIFDEVDAGIGGETAHAVGRCLAALGDRHQVLVVTHLAQVAAYADQQVAVVKSAEDDTTVSHARVLASEERVVELSRMLSGSPDSEAANDHAVELLVTASRDRRH
ncbi:MAG: DNA repair protein RecN [Acidimicrobiia bacterium]|nr:DNA repair protein RecN [Acidimicrobiia bacterium]MDH5236447.1 DNA repair protein RecN [Acidimicrobiia bacterium]